MRAVLMAGGKGSRLTSITNDEIPKPMVKLCGKPILEHQINVLRKNNIKDIIMIVGYLHEKIQDYFGHGENFGVKIHYIVENEPMGTAGAFYYLRELINEDFLLVFGDLIFDISVKKMLNYHKSNNSKITLLVHPNSHPYDSDLVLTNENGKVVKFDSKNNVRSYFYKNLVNSGIYIISNNVLESFRELKKTDLEKDIINPLVLDGKEVYAYVTSEYVKDVGTPKRLRDTEEDIRKSNVANKNLENPQKCIFIDRDGTINKYVGLLSNIDDFELEQTVSEALKLLNKSEYITIVITNQPVVARNMCTVSDIERIHRKMETLLGTDGVYVDGVEFCPHHPDKGYPEENPLYKIKCNCRKPKTGLIEKSVIKYNIDILNSWFIGDSTIDIQTGKNAGLKTVLLKTGVGGKDNKFETKADLECNNLIDAVEKILKSEGK